MEQTKMVDDAAYCDLAYAIVAQAVDDYREAIRDKSQSGIIDCEHFFKSKWARLLCQQYDPLFIMEKVRKQTELFISEAEARMKLEKEQKEAFKCPICGNMVDIQFAHYGIKKGQYNWRAKCRSEKQEGCGFFCWYYGGAKDGEGEPD